MHKFGLMSYSEARTPNARNAPRMLPGSSGGALVAALFLCGREALTKTKAWFRSHCFRYVPARLPASILHSGRNLEFSRVTLLTGFHFSSMQDIVALICCQCRFCSQLNRYTAVSNSVAHTSNIQTHTHMPDKQLHNFKFQTFSESL